VNIHDKTGNDWNKAWADKMVMNHEAFAEQIKNSAKDVKDTA